MRHRARDVIAPLVMMVSAPTTSSFSGGKISLRAALSVGCGLPSGDRGGRHCSRRAFPAEVLPSRRGTLSGDIGPKRPRDMFPRRGACTTHDEGFSRKSVKTVAPVQVDATTPTGAFHTMYTIDMDEHPDVASVAAKHMNQLHRFLAEYPISAHTREAYALATSFVQDFFASEQRRNQHGDTAQGPESISDVSCNMLTRDLQTRFPVVLDSGCGTGRSSVHLANTYPHLPVLGVDKSAVRLAKGGGGRETPSTVSKPDGDGDCVGAEESYVPGVGDGDVSTRSKDMDNTRRRAKGNERVLLPRPRHPRNLLLLRADVVDLWLLAVRDNVWDVVEHAILYPNPYPKRSQLRSRWHGHPVFPVLLCLGGTIMLRSNWKTYLDEVCQAVLAIAEEAEGVRPCSTSRGSGNVRNHVREACGPDDFTGQNTASAPLGVRSDAGLSEETRSAGPQPSDDLHPRKQERMLFSQERQLDGGCVPKRRERSASVHMSGREGLSAAARESALSYARSARAGPKLFLPVEPLTNFESKYKAVGESVYELKLVPHGSAQ